MKRGLSKGCDGCRELGRNRRHGLSHSRLWRAWTAMIARCYRPTNKSYPDYGGRGITVCERWRHRIDEFAADMGEPPDGYTLDRIDVNGPYAPENCRWVPKADQARNTRRNLYVDLSDGRRVTMSEFAREVGIDRRTLEQRWHKGDRGDRLTRPVSSLP